MKHTLLSDKIMINKDYSEERKQVSVLIFKVLTQQICVREALERFPKDIKDDSIDCAWHALIHFEADEDIRRRDPEYAQEQDEYLEMMAFLFQEGHELPENIIESYTGFYDGAETPKTYDTFWKKLKNLFKFTI